MHFFTVNTVCGVKIGKGVMITSTSGFIWFSVMAFRFMIRVCVMMTKVHSEKA